MAENHTSYVLDLKGNIDNRARQYSRDLARFSRSGRRSMERLDNAARAAGRGIDALGNQYSALLTGGAAFAAGRYLTNLDERFTRIGITAQVSAEKVAELKNRIFEVSQMPDIRVSAGQLTAAFEEILEKTGDIEFATKNLRNFGLAMQATGADGRAIGAIAAEFQKMGVTDPDKILRMLDLLNVQGKEGAFTLAELAQLGPRVVTAYTSVTDAARGSVKTIREMGAALQIIRMGTGSSEQAATAFEAVIRELTNPKKLEQLHDLGIQVFDPEALKRNEEILRPINKLLLEINKATGGKRTILGQIFGEESIRAFNAINPEDMARFYNVQATGKQTIADAARAADTMSAALTSLLTALQKFASANLADDIEALADAINNLDPDTLEALLKVGAGTIAAGGALFAGRKLWQGGKAIGGMFGAGGGDSGGVVGETIDGFANVQKVFVVNMPAGGLGGGVASRTRNIPGWMMPAALTLGSVGAVGIGAVGAAELNKAINDPAAAGFVRSGSRLTQMGDVIEHLFSDWFGAGDKLDDAAARMERAAERMENAETTINVEVDQDGRASVRGVTSHLRDPYTGQHLDPYAGPMTAGGG